MAKFKGAAPLPVPEALPNDEAVVETDDAAEVRRAVVGEAWHGWRADKVAVALAPEFSRSHLQGLIEDGALCVDGVALTTASRKLRAGQALALELRPTAESLAFVPQPMALALLFEDEHLMVIHKPAGLVVHPGAGNWSGTLLNGLLAHHAAAATLPRAGIVHRLDKDTSGLMVVGKSLPAVTALSRDIAARAVQRHYLALVHGDVGRTPFTIEAPIARDPVQRVRMAVVSGGRAARTDVIPQAFSGDIAALGCRLHTGRTHQIRVHLAHRGHPLVADATYGGAPALGLVRQGLHALQLAFVHPISGAPLRFEAPPPADFSEAWRQVSGSAPRWIDTP